ILQVHLKSLAVDNLLQDQAKHRYQLESYTNIQHSFHLKYYFQFITRPIYCFSIYIEIIFLACYLEFSVTVGNFTEILDIFSKSRRNIFPTFPILLKVLFEKISLDN